MKYKLLLVDIDGTLLARDGKISAGDRDALAKACHSGTKVSLSTGRVPQACLAIINQLSLNGCHIFFDGALISNTETDEEIYVKPISKHLVRQIVDFVHLNQINIDLYSATRYFIERETWTSDIRRQFFGLQPTIMDFTQLWLKERIIKGTLVICSAEERAKADSFRLQFKDSLSFSWTKTPAYPDVDFINVVDPEVSKGKALEALASYMGIPLTEVMVIGDGTNDISLFASAGLSVAMNNAPPEVKVVANYITLDVDHSGVAAAINRFLL